MNERIEELAIKAKFMAEEDINKRISYDDGLKTFSENFAELIVKECAGIYMKIDNGNDHLGTDDYLEALYRHFLKIKNETNI